MNAHVKPLRPARGNALPANCPPRGLSREEAAAYVGISPALLDNLIEAGEAPKPKRFRGRVVWDRLKLDAMFADADDAAGRNVFD